MDFILVSFNKDFLLFLFRTVCQFHILINPISTEGVGFFFKDQEGEANISPPPSSYFGLFIWFGLSKVYHPQKISIKGSHTKVHTPSIKTVDLRAIQHFRSQFNFIWGDRFLGAIKFERRGLESLNRPEMTKQGKVNEQ